MRTLHEPSSSYPLKRGHIALLALVGYGVLLGAVLYLSAPWKVHVHLPVYGNDSIKLTRGGAILIGLGTMFTAYGA